MGVRVKNGTPVHGEPLCETCVYAQVRRGFRESEMLVICVAQDPALRVPFPVRECSVYRDKTRPSIYEMQQIAFIVTPRGPKHATGFASGASSEPRKTEVELILEDK
jgi:hypothetical protein